MIVTPLRMISKVLWVGHNEMALNHAFPVTPSIPQGNL